MSDTRNTVNETQKVDVYHIPTGWYWCVEGCPVGGGPFGPFTTESEARTDSTKEAK